VIEPFTAQMVDLAARDAWRGPVALHPLLDVIGASATRVRLEVIRRASATKLFVVVDLAAWPDLPDALAAEHGYRVKRGETWARLTRRDAGGDGDDTDDDDDGEDLLVAREGSRIAVEWSRSAPALDAERAFASFASVASLEPFAVIARPPARLRSWGVALDRARGPLALVTVDLDAERLADDEALLRERGFREAGDPDDAIWNDGEGHSIVWAGGTAYGYLGPVPESAGGWG
jgi:hypothetical protein